MKTFPGLLNGIIENTFNIKYVKLLVKQMGLSIIISNSQQ